MTSHEAYYILNLLTGIGPIRVRALVAELGTPQAILSTPESRLAKVPGIGVKLAALLAHWQEHADLAAELAAAKRAGARLIACDEADYPAALSSMTDPPLALYIAGDLEALRLCQSAGLALVGTRQPTLYGQGMADRLAASAVKAGLVVVSGLALGIDRVVHETTLKHGGRTVAVLGGGLAQIYPGEHTELARRIREHGALVSENALLVQPDRRSFPKRNRIIAGLSLGVLVVEAGSTSGALITARQALDQGKTIFAVPGRVDVPTARGCHALLKQGARLVESLDDVLEEFRFLPGFIQQVGQPELFESLPKPRGEPLPPTVAMPAVDDEGEPVAEPPLPLPTRPGPRSPANRPVVISSAAYPPPKTPPAPKPAPAESPAIPQGSTAPGGRRGKPREITGDPLQDQLLALLRQGDMTLDELTAACEVPVAQVLTALFHLELMRRVKQFPGRRFALLH